MTKNKYLDKYATITTKDNNKYNIKKVRIYIGGKINYYGKQYIISKVSNENITNKINIVDEVYSLDNNRLRFLSDTIKKPTIFNTIEYTKDHSEERPIKVISEFEDATTEILSIPDIKKFESDLIIMENNKIISKTDLQKENVEKNKIKKLLLKISK